MRLISTFTLLSLGLFTWLAAACGDDGVTMPDAPALDIGFNRPLAALKANMEQSENSWIEIGPANLGCLGTPTDDVANTSAVTINTKVQDFQSKNRVPNATVTVFKDQDIDSPEGAPAVSDATDATVSVIIPVGTKRFGYKMVHPNALDTLLLNQTLDKADVNATPQSIEAIQSVSTATGATLPALIGVTRTAGTGILAGLLRDCNGDAVSNFIATVSSTDATVTHLAGVDTYYFSSSVGLPVRHSQQASSSKNGLFIAIEMNPTAEAYVQVWGYKTDADVAADNLTLIAQLKTAVIADVVITGSYEPLRTGN